MQQAVCDRGKHDPSREQEHEACIQGIDSGEQLTPAVCGALTGPIPPSNIAALRNASSQPSASKYV